MLYVLPPPRAPSPPSPWGILCAATTPNSEQTLWESSTKRHPPRIRFRTFFTPSSSTDDTTDNQGDEVDAKRSSKSLSECYFAGKGTALVLPAEAQKSNGGPTAGAQGSNIQKHLQSMFYLLRPEETLKMAVKLESVHPGRTRYLVVVSRMGRRAEECCLLGIDCNEKTTVGLVLRVLADTAITLDGDGGFSVGVCGRLHIFKPVSVQAMWSALQTLHKASSKAREQNYFQGGLSHDWVTYYEERIASDRSCLNEWDAMDDLESRRPPSPDSLRVRTKPSATDETERLIRSTLKEIMMTVDLDEVTSKYIRQRLEEELDVDLGGYKSFIDREMLTILGQMDAPTEVFDHVYLGSEWNASNYEELKRNGVRHILNVTREIDNFFPGTFDYLNVRVLDDEKTDLLKHWDNTYKYITKAREEGSKVLVHCKMGISRSASVVIAYAMKAYNWDLPTALKHVKEKRNCIKPNTNFVTQLETYQGMLDAMKNKEKLQRSKSETNLKNQLPGSQPTPLLQALSRSAVLQTTMSGQDLRQMGSRPKSWSPDLKQEKEVARIIHPFRSLENLCGKSSSKESLGSLRRHKSLSQKDSVRNVLLPCDNGESYSVSPNQIRHLLGEELEKASVKQIVNEFELVKEGKRKLVLNLPPNESNPKLTLTNEDNLRTLQTTKDTWDPGEQQPPVTFDNDCDLKSSVSDEPMAWTSMTVLQTNTSKVPERKSKSKTLSDPFSNQLDRFFDREERKQQRISMPPLPSSITDCDDFSRQTPSRQSSWGSYDSAVGMEPRENIPSRHSSWGSGDNRTLPSRNSSWGSYDMRPRGPVHYMNEKGEKVLHADVVNNSSGVFPYDKEDIPWHRGTVKRTKQKLEEGKNPDEFFYLDGKSSSTETLPISDSSGTVETFNIPLIRNGELNESSSAISAKISIVKPNNLTNSSRLSTSAPENSTLEIIPHEPMSRSNSNVINTAQCFSVKQHKSLLESRSKEVSSSKAKTKTDGRSKPGIVRNLKKEFEAKTNVKVVQEENSKVRSMPSSPVNGSSPTNSDPGEDLNFKKLRGKFEPEPHVNLRPKLFNANRLNKNGRFSCIEMSSDKNPLKFISSYNGRAHTDKLLDGEFKRPPVPPVVKNPNPNVVVATVIAKAAKKQQQYGKSHPLARINIKPRHNNPVYNTM